MKYLAITIMLVICMPLFSADDVPLPPDAAKLVDGAAKAFTEIETKALLSKLDTLTALIPKLTKAQDTATKAGKLEVSLAIKAKIDEYRKQVDEITALRPAPKVVSTSKDVVLYAQPDFKGPGTIVKQFDTIIDAYKISFPNDGLRSVRLPAGYVLVTYADNLGAGTECTIATESADLTGTQALGMTSFMVKRIK
jgi:hypothetical protein